MLLLFRLLVMEWTNKKAEVQKQREENLEKKLKEWDAEVEEEMKLLNKMASPMPKKRSRESMLDGSSDEKGSQGEDSEGEPLYETPHVRPRRRALPSTASTAPSRKPRRKKLASHTDAEKESVYADSGFDAAEPCDDDLFGERFKPHRKPEKPREPSETETASRSKDFYVCTQYYVTMWQCLVRHSSKNI